ncbi:hypothetical protein [Bacteroides sp. 224]|uniref:hypothetical protein n=1 Tax=Bacteroides sp. 224 TaxID=2302936 RepID=UPI0013D50E66|nr:hypothetical protein [Bacteroides sp. 224]NDV66686.1 hypothetical protein [Bacteroides sp. 224]
MEKKKTCIIVGIVTFFIGCLIVYPIESRDTVTIEELKYTFSTLITGILIALYGLLGSNILKCLLFLFFWISMSMLFVYLWEDDGWGRGIVVFWLGLPSGAISGILFLIINHFFLRKKSKSKMRYVKQVGTLIVIYLIVVLIMKWGGDVLFYLQQ